MSLNLSYFALYLTCTCFFGGCSNQSQNNSLPCADGLLPLEDPFLGDNYDTKEMFTLLSGNWSTKDQSIQITINDKRALFLSSPQINKLFLPLANHSVLLDDTLTFNLDNTIYSLYWVYDDPQVMRLIAKNKSMKGVTLEKINK